MPEKKLGERPAEPPRQIAATLPPALEDAGNHPQIAACRKNVALCPAREPRLLAESVGDERPVEFRRSLRTERGNQPGLGFAGVNGAGKDGHGRQQTCFFRQRNRAFQRSPRARREGWFSSAFSWASRS